MYGLFLSTLRTLNELLTAGIAIFAFSLLIYALSFNLRDRVTRSFAIILLCVVVVFVAEALGSVAPTHEQLEFWLRLQWLGIIFLPPAYLHFSDALLSTTGRPSRGRRRLAVRIAYLVSILFLVTLPFEWLVGPLVRDTQPAPHLEQTPLTWGFTAYYALVIAFSFANLYRAYKRTVTRTSRRRISYLMLGSLAPALGSYPYLLFGSGLASQTPVVFWVSVVLGNMAVSALLVLMAYAVAFFGVAWPDRVVKRRLMKWIFRGPVTASTVLAFTTIVRRAGDVLGFSSTALTPIVMAGTILLMEHLITLFSPLAERWFVRGSDADDSAFLQTIEERLLTQGDLRQFLEALVAAVGDRLQTSKAFVASLGARGVELFITIGGDDTLAEEDLSENLLQIAAQNGTEDELFSWGDYWLVPLFEPEGENRELLGMLGVERDPEQPLDIEQSEALSILAERAALALRDRRRQQQVFSSLEALTPQVDLIQRLRAAARYDGTEMFTATVSLEERSLTQWVKDALSHYWGGPKLTENPLLQLSIVQEAMQEHEDNPVNALRSVLRRAIEQVRPEGERRFTAEWILYNILEMKFMEGRKVREIALRLAMSEADLYRKQRVAIEAVANAIAEMEQEARLEKPPEEDTGMVNQHQS
jgi:hypothetical protein